MQFRWWALMDSAVQFVAFCLVGVATTIIDFSIYNLLTRPAAGWRRIPANLVSVTVAMAWAFVANWLLVFHPAGQDWIGRAGRFLVTTAFSAFVLQNAVLYLTSHMWAGPVNAALFLARKARRGKSVDAGFVARNTCKVLAVTVGLAWNFLWYKFFVYAD